MPKYTKFIRLRQTNSRDCGLICLKMICLHYGKKISTESIRELINFEKDGVSMLGIYKAAQSLGFQVHGLQVNKAEHTCLTDFLPVIAHYKGNHFVVIHKIEGDYLHCADPAGGKTRIHKSEFYSTAADKQLINILVLEPTPAFELLPEEEEKSVPPFIAGADISKFSIYVFPLLLSIVTILVIQFILPFFTKSAVDIGLDKKDLELAKIFMLAQLVLIVSKTGIDILRNRLLMHFSSRLNFMFINRFLIKLSILPLNFFESRKIGDILQRFGDHTRIESFISKLSFNIFFSILQIFIFLGILWYFNFNFFLIFIVAASFYISWVLFFLKKRVKIDKERFEINANNHSLLIQFIQGIHDVKVNQADETLLKKWQANQERYINNNFRSLNVSQVQQTGSVLIFEFFQVVFTFISISLVVKGQISIGVMLTLQFLIGQLISPIDVLVNSILSAQDAKISYDRLLEIWRVKDELQGKSVLPPHVQPAILLDDVSFQYPNQQEDQSLRKISIAIQPGSVTALVGLSGSGKTTIIKLLLGYYENYRGSILIDGISLKEMDIKAWRKKCGTVMQESHIFNETIAFNIALEENPDLGQLRHASLIANIHEFIEGLPQGYDTLIGNEGKGLSQGQRQRILIARAIYKNPDVIFLDEATNALDSENEEVIVRNLKEHLAGKTIIIAAHRLSTIKHADNIVLLRHGVIEEMGLHNELMVNQGNYFGLVEKQLN